MTTLAHPPRADADDEERLAWLDDVAARLIGAAAGFCDEAGALVPAQRALLLLAGTRTKAREDIASLSRALRRIDEQLGSQRGGFSRLLDAALSSGDVLVTERLDAHSVDEGLQPIALALEELGRELLAVDDLAHALSLPADLPAGAVVLEGALDLAEGLGVVDEAGVESFALAWVARRGLDGRLAAMLGLRRALEHLDAVVVDEAVLSAVARPLALWVLAYRLAHRVRLDDAPDRDELERLLAAAGLVPLEVFDAASLWSGLDE